MLASEHPAYGNSRPEATLLPEGQPAPPIAIKNNVYGHGLGTRYDRGLVQERANSEKVLELTAEQAAFLDKLNSCSREHHVESTAVCELLSAASLFVGTLKLGGQGPSAQARGYLRSYALGFLHVSMRPESVAAALHNDAQPFYCRLDLSVEAILTDNRREFCGAERHGYEFFLDISVIQHRRTKVLRRKTLRRAFQRHCHRRIVPHQDARNPLRKRRGAPGRPRHLAASP